MKKLANLIVKFRYFILVFFIVFAGVSLFLSEQVKVNHDLTAYMPESSETSRGKKIMDDEFSGVETSTLMVMFDNLPEEQKQNVKSDLEKIDNVKSVAHDDSADFNKDNHTLYTITVDGAADSKEAADVFNKVDGTYKEQYELHYSGDVASNNAEVVSIWIIVTAIGAAMLILIFLCDSFVEPFLFLFTIGLAVFINAGTNIMFPQISHITKAIAAVLQLALSMDYSIMLMNRYRQEKQAIKARSKADNQRAMKAALANSFGSISSSSITTVVGLFVLVFMSFTIGRDMGLIMSKGVILSLLTIFTCLPGLILLFDRLITKTTKKHSLNFKMTRAGNFAYKLRKAAPFAFLVILVGSFMLKGNVAITYTGSENDVIGSIFPKTNQIAVVYGNEDESKVAEYCRSYEGRENVKQVLCYGNTINEPEKVTELTAKMADLGKSIDVEDYLLRVVYYHYYNPYESHQMTVSEFVNFVQNDILQNPELKEHISAGSAAQIDKLSNFTDLNKLNQPRTISELASILEIDESGVKDLMVLYGAKDPAGALSLEQVFNFITKDIYGTSYEAELSDTMKAKISAVAPFINKTFINTELNAAGLAKAFGLDEATVSRLLFYNEYISRTDTDLTMSLEDLLALITTDETLKAQLASNTALATLLSNDEIVNYMITHIQGEYGYADMATQISGAIANYVMMLMQAGYTEQAMALINATSGMAESLPVTLKQVYVYRADQIAAATATMTPYEFVSFILAHAEDPALDGTIPSATIATLTELKKVMDAVNAETKFTAAELASFLNTNLDSVKTLYSYYNYLYVNNNPTLSLQNTIKFILNEVIPSEKYASRLAPEKQEKVRNVNAVIDSAVNGVQFDHTGLYNLLRPLSATIEPKTIDVAYIYHGSKADYNEDWTMTVEEFVNYLNNDILQDARLSSLISDEKKADIIAAKDTIAEAKEMLVGKNYSRAIFNTYLEPEGDQTFDFIRTLKSAFSENSSTPSYVIGNSPMALEMSETFNDEMNLITILTMVSIFVVVAFTFRSIIIPFILVLIIQTAVWMTMAMVSFTGEPLYFISLIIVQSILMGATIDYAILYTSYYLENRRNGVDIRTALINSYSNSIHTILCSASVLVIVTAIVGNLASAIAAKICITISEGTLFSAILILVMLPAILAAIDKLIVKKKTK